MAEGKKASQFKQNAATVYETSVYHTCILITITLWPAWQPGNLVGVEKEGRQFKQNAAILYHTPCIQTLGPGCSSGGKESEQILANLQQHLNCTDLGTWQPGQSGRGEEKKRGNYSRMPQFSFQTTLTVLTLWPDSGSGEESKPIQANLPQFLMKQSLTVLTLGPGSQGNLVEVEKEYGCSSRVQQLQHPCT